LDRINSANFPVSTLGSLKRVAQESRLITTFPLSLFSKFGMTASNNTPAGRDSHVQPSAQPQNIVHDIATQAHRLFGSAIATRQEPAANLTRLMRRVTPHELGFSPEMLLQGPTDDIEFFPVYECELFTMCVFWLKQGSSMPIHNHPGMHVFSRVVYGNLHVKTYQLLPKPSPQAITRDMRGRAAAVLLDSVIQHQGIDSVLQIEPKEIVANLHSFFAVTNGVLVLDIIGPPYDDGERHCSYFREALSDEVKNYVLPDIQRALLKTQKKQETRQRTVSGQRKWEARNGGDFYDAESSPEKSFAQFHITPPMPSELPSDLLSELVLEPVFVHPVPDVMDAPKLWLIEDALINYDCTEREYIGDQVIVRQHDHTAVTKALQVLADRSSRTDISRQFELDKSTGGLANSLAAKLKLLADLSASGVDILGAAASLQHR